MTILMFVDESHCDGYSVLLGVAVRDRSMAPLEYSIQEARFAAYREDVFGDERKASKLLLHPEWCMQRIAEGSDVAALSADRVAGQRFVLRELDAAIEQQVEVMAVVTEPTKVDALRDRAYLYLLERFASFCMSQFDTGLVIYDEIEPRQGAKLLSRLSRTLTHDPESRPIGERILHQMFARSEYSIGLQLADVLAYVAAQGLRLEGMRPAQRHDLDPFLNRMVRMAQGWHVRGKWEWGLLFVPNQAPWPVPPPVTPDETTQTEWQGIKLGL